MITVTAAGESVAINLTVGGPPMPAGWTKVTFYDDFSNGLGKWNVRNNDWSPNEESIRLAKNVFINNGILTIRALHESVTVGATTRQYSSGYLATDNGKFSQQYGRWEFRMLFPAKSKGVWPAAWLRCNTGLGELDVIEAAVNSGVIVQTLHQTTNSDQPKVDFEDHQTDFTQWHTYWVEREPGVIRWGIDDRTTFVVTSAQLSWLESSMNEAMNIRLNLQVNGAMPEYYNQLVDSTTVFPADLQVDWVRVLSR